MKVSFLNNPRTGFSLIEIIVSAAIAAVLVTSFFSLVAYAKKTSLYNKRVLQAELYATELVEIARDLEKNSWATLNISSCKDPSSCVVTPNAGVWTISAGSETLDTIFTRTFFINDVYRNQATFPNEIVTSGGVLDVDSKEVVSRVSWTDNLGTHSRELSIIVYNQ